MRIGDSIIEAIDWTQDQLKTTRPLAERTLFSLLAEKRVTETDAGFMLAEDIEDDEVKRKHKGLANRFHRSRKRGLDLKTWRKKLRQKLNFQKFDAATDAADHMDDATEDSL
jgi:hypothetical protein